MPRCACCTCCACCPPAAAGRAAPSEPLPVLPPAPGEAAAAAATAAAAAAAAGPGEAGSAAAGAAAPPAGLGTRKRVMAAEEEVGRSEKSDAAMASRLQGSASCSGVLGGRAGFGWVGEWGQEAGSTKSSCYRVAVQCCVSGQPI